MAANSAHPLSPEIRQFIAAYIRSVEQLEVLCLLSGNPSKIWTSSEVFRQIQSSEKSVIECLEGFTNAGLLKAAPEGGFYVSPQDHGLVQTISDLGRTYRERRVSVIECIYRKPSDPIQDFADAFRLRKEK